MPSGEANYAARFRTPEFLERGRANAIQCAVYAAGAQIVPSSATVTIYDSVGAVVVGPSAATVAGGGTCSYSSPAALFDSYALGIGWRVHWALTISSKVYTFRRDAMLVRRILYPVITDTDLLQRHPDLGDNRDSGRTTYQNEIDEAWYEITNRLVGRGQRPQLVMDSSALGLPHLYLTLRNIFLAFHPSSAGENGPYWVLANHYGELYKQAWSEMSFPVDEDEDGTTDSPADRQIAPQTFIGSARGLRWLR